MLILSLDTTTRAGSCALLRDESLREEASDASRDHAERLPGDLAALLQHQGVSLQTIDAFAVATGPGSFTGLRVGIATMQGLAVATGKPLFGVSAFDALAMLATSLNPDVRYNRMATWVDAWRGEVFAAVYQEGRERDAPVVAAPDFLLERLLDGPTLFAGDGALLYEREIRERLGPAAVFSVPVAPLLGGAVARLAAQAYLTGQRPLPHAIRPMYVRRSDAELAAARRGVL